MRAEDIHVGDRVRFRQWDDMLQEFGHTSSGEDINTPFVFVEDMRPLCGAEATVVRIEGDWVILDPRPSSYSIDPGMLEPAEPEYELEPSDCDMSFLYEIKV